MRPVRKDFGAAAAPSDPALALRRLVESLGAYCSWCEMPVGVDAGLDGGASFPAESSSWDDLRVACAPCRAARSRTVEGDASAVALRPDAVADADGVVRVAGDPTHRLLTFAMDGRSPAALAEAGLLRMTAEERARPEAQAARREKVLVVVPGETYLAARGDESGALRERALATVRALDLNRHDPSDPRAADRRVANRTYVADHAAAALRDLSRSVDALRAAPGDDALEHPRTALLVAAIRETARAMGFWSVWMWTFGTALEQAEDPVWRKLSPEGRASLLARLFVRHPPSPGTDEKSGAGRPVFPGTDDARLA